MKILFWASALVFFDKKSLNLGSKVNLKSFELLISNGVMTSSIVLDILQSEVGSGGGVDFAVSLARGLRVVHGLVDRVKALEIVHAVAVPCILSSQT